MHPYEPTSLDFPTFVRVAIHAVETNNKPLLEKLYSLQADFKQVENNFISIGFLTANDGNTLFNYAIKTNAFAILELMLNNEDNSALFKQKNKQNLTPWQLANQIEHADCKDVLQKNNFFIASIDKTEIVAKDSDNSEYKKMGKQILVSLFIAILTALILFSLGTALIFIAVSSLFSLAFNLLLQLFELYPKLKTTQYSLLGIGIGIIMAITASIVLFFATMGAVPLLLLQELLPFLAENIVPVAFNAIELTLTFGLGAAVSGLLLVADFIEWPFRTIFNKVKEYTQAPAVDNNISALIDQIMEIDTSQLWLSKVKTKPSKARDSKTSPLNNTNPTNPNNP